MKFILAEQITKNNPTAKMLKSIKNHKIKIESRAAIFSATALAILMVFMFFPITYTAKQNVTADSSDKSNILYKHAQTAPSLSMSIGSTDLSFNIIPNETMGEISTNVTVVTTNYTGYVLGINMVGTETALVHEKDSTQKIEMVSQSEDPDNMTVGRWGLSTSCGEPYAKVYNIPASNEDTFNICDSADDDPAITLKFRTRVASSQTAGTYSNIVSLSAVRKPNTYSISFDKNLSETVSNMPTTQSGTLYSSSEAINITGTEPTAEHYNFVGWSLPSAEGCNKPGTDIWAAYEEAYIDASVNNNAITLCARWEPKNYEVTFSVSSGAPSSALTVHGLANPKYNAAIDLTTNEAIINSGVYATAETSVTEGDYIYTFTGWTNNCGSTISEDCSIVANYDKDVNGYQITFVTNGSGYGYFEGGDFADVETITLIYPEDTAISIDNTTQTVTLKPDGFTMDEIIASAADDDAEYEYAFDSWTNRCGRTLTSDCTITANFTRTTNMYTVTVNGYEMTVETSDSEETVNTYSVQLPYGDNPDLSSEILLLANYSVTIYPFETNGYTWSRWDTDCYNDSDVITHSCTVTAIYEKNGSFATPDDIVQEIDYPDLDFED